MNSPLALLKSDSLNRRELTFKALAGLCGGAIGWLPVELASHNSHLGEAQTDRRSMVAYYVSAAIAAGADRRVHHGRRYHRGSQSRRRSQRRFIRGFVICALLSLLSTYLGNYRLQLGSPGRRRRLQPEWRVGFGLDRNPGHRAARWDGRSMERWWAPAWDSRRCTMENIPKGAVGGLVGGAVGGIAFDLIGAIVGGGAGLAVLWRSGHRPRDRIVHRAGAGADQGRVGHGRAGTAARTRSTVSKARARRSGAPRKIRSACSATRGATAARGDRTARRRLRHQKSRGAGRHLRQRQSNRKR